MAEYQHPGVYVEELPAGVHDIEGGATGVAGFIGVGDAPPGGPFTSAAEFELGHARWQAVSDFFAEGGARLYVAFAATAAAADVAAAAAQLGPVDVIAAPGLSGADVGAALIAAAAAGRAFAIVDPPAGLDAPGVQAFRAGFDSARAALYWPWLITGAGATPPSAAIAGVYARVDASRGVWKAPANEPLHTATGLARAVTKAEQDTLNPLGINCLRFFPGRGNLVWGARTMASDPEWKYVSVRRQVDWIERSLDAGLAWTAFEPNAEPLWANVRRAVAAFLSAHWRAGGLQGSTAKQAFFVLADRTTMTQADIDNGRLVVEVGVAAVRPAEFTVLRITLATLAAAT